MKFNLIAMTSITYAQRARKLLRDRRLYCEILKTPSELFSGCGYSIRVKSPIKRITRLLDDNGIKYKGAVENYAL